ncbi:MAG: trigger factor family protein, partial [Synergistaceae bacterium]|nr:trigger factor family protein [Synergistaceae bacterium]
MKTELLGQEKNIVKIKLEITPEEFADGLNKAVKQLSQEVKIPGFRKGHAPRKILEMRFGRDALYNE